MVYAPRIRIKGAKTNKPVVRRELRDRGSSGSVKSEGIVDWEENASLNTKRTLQDEVNGSTADWALDNESVPLTSALTGQPLEEPPSLKIKKEAFGARRRGRGKPMKRSSTPELSEQDDDESFATTESNYRAKLNTQESEAVTKLSTERDHDHRKLRPIPKQSREPMPTKINGQPKQASKKRGKPANNVSLVSKRIKQSPRKKTSAIGFGLPAKPEPVPAETDSTEDPTVNNYDFCSSCGLTGLFLCCEGCPRSFHFQCLDPPAEEADLPDHWFCKECMASRQKPKKHHIGIFSALLDDLQTHNPLAFRLPREVAEAFEGVTMNKDGDFEDDSMKPFKSYSQLLAESQDPLTNVYDKEGNPLFCYKCAKSGLNDRLLTRCDYCSLAWHLDCLDPPLTSVKMLGSKWMCPNHVETVNKSRRKLRHQPKVQVALTRNFKAPKDSNIEIINVEDYDVDEFDLEDRFPVDPIFQFRSTPDGTAYRLNKETVKNTKAEETENVTYQIKEEAIILDFIRGTKSKQEVQQRKQDSENLKIYQQVPPDLKDYLVGVSRLSERSIITNKQKKLNLDQLLKQIDDEYRIENEELSTQELHDLMIVKKLMELKGHEKLLEFLQS
ncbi:hypothetical protein OGAPHI_001602 [Ogataea philodendri]|uniref:PHD-type domain-containing protein n=1 Tax=Ogataea philodendri TaxID=1378263 RepID=A0A9P8T839_9ASCO|nr:uncharacterized protein OGAPHI_001602 [Ogataea philodendri]KAH3669481.1 hypothetical protein OGAPHI_001602 [Ogataea philodendri]